MIDFDFENEFKTDYEIPINLAALDGNLEKTHLEYLNLLGNYFDNYSMSYLHAADILFKDYMQVIINNQTNTSKNQRMPEEYICMFGPIFHSYHQSIELKLKSLLLKVGCQFYEGHKLSELVKRLDDYYYTAEVKEQFDFINAFDKYAENAQLGRYPINTKGNIIGKIGGKIVFVGNEEGNGGIATMVYHIHELYKSLFPNLKRKIK